jgi:hypothetical protein
MTVTIGRRELLVALGGAAAAWPLTARAQQPERMRRIGVLMNLASNDAEGQARLAAFHQGLQQSGWTVGRNVQIDYRCIDSPAGITERRGHVAIDIDGLAVFAVAREIGDVVLAIERLARRTTASSARSIMRLETNHSGIRSFLCGVLGWQKSSGMRGLLESYPAGSLHPVGKVQQWQAPGSRAQANADYSMIQPAPN